MGLFRCLFSGIMALVCYQPVLLGIGASGLDIHARFLHRLQWVTVLEWKQALEGPYQPFQVAPSRIGDPKIDAVEVLGSLPLLQKMSADVEAKFTKSINTDRQITLYHTLAPFNVLTDGYVLGTSADTKLNMLVALARACLNLPLFEHTGSRKVKDGLIHHHSVHKFASKSLRVYAYDRYQDFLVQNTSSDMGFENGEFCSTALLALVNAQEHQLVSLTKEIIPKWSEYRWREQKPVSIRPFTPRYEESFYSLLQTIYTSLGDQVVTTPIQLDHALRCREKQSQLEAQERKAQEMRAIKNRVGTQPMTDSPAENPDLLPDEEGILPGFEPIVTQSSSLTGRAAFLSRRVPFTTL